jgi:hypothetical protein
MPLLRNVFQLEGRGYDIKSQPAKHHNYFPWKRGIEEKVVVGGVGGIIVPCRST